MGQFKLTLATNQANAGWGEGGGGEATNETSCENIQKGKSEGGQATYASESCCIKMCRRVTRLLMNSCGMVSSASNNFVSEQFSNITYCA